MDLRRLRHLTEAIEQGSLSKAASRLGISQPALSKSLRLLEAELDVPLLERSSTGVAATPFGQSLYAHAKALEAEVRHAHAEIGQLRGKHPGSVHIGALPSVAGGILATAVAAAFRTHPGLVARVVEKMNFELLPALRRGEFDFVLGLADDDATQPGIQRRVVLRDELAVIARPGHALLQGAAPSAASLAAYPWLFPMMGSSQRHVLEQFFLAAGVEPPAGKIECTSVQLIKSVVRQSDHLGVLPPHVMVDEIASGQLRRLPVRSEVLRRTIAIYQREHHPLSAAARSIIRAIEDVCADLSRQASTPQARR